MGVCLFNYEIVRFFFYKGKNSSLVEVDVCIGFVGSYYGRVSRGK